MNYNKVIVENIITIRIMSNGLLHTVRIIIMIQFEHSEGQRQHSHPHRHSNNKYLKDLPEFKYPEKIEAISYPNNMISKIRTSISKAVNTHSINLSHNKITSIQPLFQLRNLKVLNVSYNMICTIGVGLGKLDKLETVDVGYNLLGTMNSIRGLVKLWQIRQGNVGIILEGNEVMKRQKQNISNVFTLNNISKESMREGKKQNEEKSYRNTSLKSTGKLHKTMVRDNKCKIQEAQTAKYKRNPKQSQMNQEGNKNLDVSMILPVFPSSDFTLSETSHRLKKQDSNKNKSASLLLLDSSSLLPSSSSHQISKNMKLLPKRQTSGQNYLQILKQLRNKNNTSKKQEQKSSYLQCQQNNSSKSLLLDAEYGKKLQQIKQKLEILLNTCCNKWQNHMFQLLKEQSEAIDVYIQIHTAILDHSKRDGVESLDLEKVKNSLQEHISQSEQIKEIIKASHKELLGILEEDKDTPVKVYRIWVNLVRDLHNVCSFVVKDAWNCLIEIDRKKQLEALQRLSPDKNSHRMFIKSLQCKKGKIRNKSKQLPNKKQDSNTCTEIMGSPSAPLEKSNQKSTSELQVLLFSNNKAKKDGKSENSNTIQKNKKIEINYSNQKSEGYDKIECDQCFIKDGEIRYLKQLLEREMENKRNQEEEMSRLYAKMEAISKNLNALGKRNKELEEKAVEKQSEIIQKLDQKITAGVYQNVLLMQAKGMEDLIKGGSLEYIPISQSYKKEQSFSNGKTRPLLNKNTHLHQNNPDCSQWGYETDRNNNNANKQPRISYFSHQTSQANTQKNLISHTEGRNQKINSMGSDGEGRVQTFESNDDYSYQNKKEKTFINKKNKKAGLQEKQNSRYSSNFYDERHCNGEKNGREASPVPTPTYNHLQNSNNSVLRKNNGNEKDVNNNQLRQSGNLKNPEHSNFNSQSSSQNQQINSNQHHNQLLAKWNSTTTAGRTTSPLSGLKNSHNQSEFRRDRSPLSGPSNTKKIQDKKPKNNISTRVGCMTIAEEDEKDQIVVSDFAVLTENNNNKQNFQHLDRVTGERGEMETKIKKSQSSASNFLDRYSNLIAYKPPDKIHNKQPYSQYISHHLRNQIMHTLLSKKSGIEASSKKTAQKNIRSDPLLKTNCQERKPHKLQYNSLPKQKVNMSVEETIIQVADRRNLSLSLDSKARNLNTKNQLNSGRGNKKPKYIKG